MSEHYEQAALITWATHRRGKYPELRLLYAIPNGGLRHVAVAGKLRREGVQSGVPDLHLPLARNGKNGLWIEMKYGRNKPTAAQKKWLTDLESEGHQVTVCRTWEEAARVIEEYLAGCAIGEMRK